MRMKRLTVAQKPVSGSRQTFCQSHRCDRFHALYCHLNRERHSCDNVKQTCEEECGGEVESVLSRHANQQRQKVPRSPNYPAISFLFNLSSRSVPHHSPPLRVPSSIVVFPLLVCGVPHRELALA